ncbi:N-acetyl-gamma-glutamyl-phosphate reductase [Bengtsoniella intestinalis]|uniref:N-acetyl-gamma-glutamyl-phosphate reductase n=1 Tax=Bengtsoniella intestinalis TaxID=3073143 RepID=UPI00391F419C
MTNPIIYIDGQEGTTGLQIFQRLGCRDDITLLQIDPALRKDTAERQRLMAQADLVFLCLPDKAAIEAVALMADMNTRIIDASTAHRTNPNWTYGFPELTATQGEAIASAKLVANPGCHATGFVSVVAPLVQAGVLSPDACLSAHSITGYSGGGKAMIADYETADKPEALTAPALYALGHGHKHLPEMSVLCGLDNRPVFNPIVADYYKGMATTVPFHLAQLNTTTQAIYDTLTAHYKDSVMVDVKLGDGSKLYANTNAGKDTLTLHVCGDDSHCTVTALFDNLGKGASGAAVQNMNLMLGFAETAGLTL